MERKLKSLTLGMGGAVLMLGTSLLAPLAAHAGADGRRNTTIALGAAAAYELLLKHQTVPALVLGAGAAYAGKRYEDARRSERDNNNRNYYRNGYSYDSSPNGYNNNNNSYPNGYNNSPNYGYNNNNGYSHGYHNNGYDNNNSDNRDYQRQGHDRDHDDNNGGQSYQHSKKNGWNGRNMPPGQWKKRHDSDDNR